MCLHVFKSQATTTSITSSEGQKVVGRPLWQSVEANVFVNDIHPFTFNVQVQMLGMRTINLIFCFRSLSFFFFLHCGFETSHLSLPDLLQPNSDLRAQA